MGGAHLQVADLLPDEEVPDRLGRFALLEELGRGGMSIAAGVIPAASAASFWGRSTRTVSARAR